MDVVLFLPWWLHFVWIFAAFGIGSMIYSGLEFGQYFELERNTKCHNVLLALTPATRMAFIFIQMYFIFLNNEVSNCKLHRIDLIYCICIITYSEFQFIYLITNYMRLPNPYVICFRCVCIAHGWWQGLVWCTWSAQIYPYG